MFIFFAALTSPIIIIIVYFILILFTEHAHVTGTELLQNFNNKNEAPPLQCVA